MPQDIKDGMSLRDWFAGMALPGLCTTPAEFSWPSGEEVAVKAYEYADAMLKARGQ